MNFYFKNNETYISQKIITEQLGISDAYFYNNIKPLLENNIRARNHSYFNTNEYYELLKNNISITLQTIQIPEIKFIKINKYEEYFKLCKKFELETLPKLIRKNCRKSTILRIRFKKVVFPTLDISCKVKILDILKLSPEYFRRKETEYIDLTENNLILNYVLDKIKDERALTIKALKDEFDFNTNEEVYRHIFNSGKLKIELTFNPQKNNLEKANKVLFVEAPLFKLTKKEQEILQNHKYAICYLFKAKYFSILNDFLK